LAISVNPASASICNGTSTQLTASGATNYSWTPSTGLSSSSGATVTASPTTTTIYNVTGTTGGCSGTKDITVTVNNATNFTIIQNPAGFNNLCNGPIDLSVPSGFTTIFWSTNAATNSISATTPGLYSATARNLEGCTVQSNQLTINQTASPQINITPSGPQSLCNGALELSATPGMSTYNWSNAQSTSTITVSQAGDFSVICYDSQGCSGESDTVTVTGGSLPQVSISAPTNTICPGETILLTADPGFSSYLWNGGQTTESITVNQAGNYSVSVLDGGCSGSSPPFTLQPGLLPTAVFTYTQSTGYTIDFENTSTNATQFFWDFGNGNTSIEENTSHIFPFDGTYPVKLITQNACGSDTLLVNVVVLKLGLNELKGVELTLAPNPFLNQLSIEISLNTPTELTLTVHSLLGQLIYSEKIQGQASINRTIDFSKLASGIYSLQLQNQEGIRVRKVVKE